MGFQDPQLLLCEPGGNSARGEGLTPSLLPPPKSAWTGAARHRRLQANLADGLHQGSAAISGALIAGQEQSDSVAGAQEVSSDANAAAQAKDTATMHPRLGRGSHALLMSKCMSRGRTWRS